MDHRRRKQEKRGTVELYVKQNKPIGEIGQILGIAECTVFDRLKRLHIKITPERKALYLNKKRGVLSYPVYSEKLAEFVGVMLGDGHIASGQIWVFVNTATDRGYISYVQTLIRFLFGAEPSCYYRKDKDMANIFLSSVDLVRYLRDIGLFATNKVRQQADIPTWIFDSYAYKRSFLRGFFDTDGSLYPLKFGIQMNFCNRSIPLLKSARRILVDLHFRPSRISCYKIYLTRRPDLYRYAQEIGFGNPKHLTKAKRFGLVAN